MKKLKERLNAKLSKNGGFTLVEMLIVVAIIAILIVVSIPLIGSNLEKARVAVDEANERTAMSMAETYFLLNSTTSGTELYYSIDKDTHQGVIVEAKPSAASFAYGSSTEKERGVGTGATPAIPKGLGLKVTVDKDGDIQKVEWVSAT